MKITRLIVFSVYSCECLVNLGGFDSLTARNVLQRESTKSLCDRERAQPLTPSSRTSAASVAIHFLCLQTRDGACAWYHHGTVREVTCCLRPRGLDCHVALRAPRNDGERCDRERAQRVWRSTSFVYKL